MIRQSLGPTLFILAVAIIPALSLGPPGPATPHSDEPAIHAGQLHNPNLMHRKASPARHFRKIYFAVAGGQYRAGRLS